MNIIEFIRHPQLIGGELSLFQETALRLMYGLELTNEQQAIACQALDVIELPPQQEYSDATIIAGRRSGKSDRIAANVAVYEAVCGGHEEYLSPGERAHIVLVAQDKRACRVLFRYILGKLQSSDSLASYLEKDPTQEEIELTNRITISIFPCSARAGRGFAVPLVIFDEVGHYRVEGVNVDKEVIDSYRPAGAQFLREKRIKISTPYGKVGELHKDFAERHQRSDLLCFRATTAEMNPAISAAYLARQRERDPELYSREFDAEFSDSLTNAINREAIEACVIPCRFELPYSPASRYFAAVDPSGGGADEFALTICHLEKGRRLVQDLIRGWRARRPQDVVAEAAGLLGKYNVREVLGDRYSAMWVQTAFQEYGISYRVAEVTASEAFLELVPAINQGAVALLDDRIQTAQLTALERRTGPAGKDAISHPRGGHDDRANVVALLAATRVSQQKKTPWARAGSEEMEIWVGGGHSVNGFRNFQVHKHAPVITRKGD